MIARVVAVALMLASSIGTSDAGDVAKPRSAPQVRLPGGAHPISEDQLPEAGSTLTPAECELHGGALGKSLGNVRDPSQVMGAMNAGWTRCTFFLTSGGSRTYPVSESGATGPAR
jgi:hypothetical protein